MEARRQKGKEIGGVVSSRFLKELKRLEWGVKEKGRRRNATPGIIPRESTQDV